MPVTKKLDRRQRYEAAKMYLYEDMSARQVGLVFGVGTTAIRNLFISDPRKYARQWYKRGGYAALLRNDVNRCKLILAQSRYHAKKYGYVPCNLTPTQLAETLAGVYKCQKCGVPAKLLKRRLDMDHDHITGDFRAWLCSLCNFGKCRKKSCA